MGSGLDSALQAHPLSGIFQIYGPDLGNRPHLLYLGVMGTPLSKVLEEAKPWMPYEIEELTFFLGHPATQHFDNFSLRHWQQSIAQAHALLVACTEPILNEIADISPKNALQVNNTGKRMALPPIVSPANMASGVQEGLR